MNRFLFGFGLFTLGLLCFAFGGLTARGQLPGTFLPVGVSVGGGVACTPNTQGGGSDSNVISLWHFDNNGTDYGLPTAHSISSLAGGAVYSATQSKFGGYSLNIVTSATSFANVPAGINIIGTSDFTIEAWMYQAGGTTTYTGWIGDDNTTTGTFANPNPGIWTSSSASQPSGTAAWATLMPGSSWHHTAFVRASGTVNFYFDGVVQGTGAASAGIVGNGTTAWKIGRGYSATYVMPSNSFIDEIRISNMARYIANFTPPILAFCNPVPPSPSATYRYWRLDITAGTSGPARIAELTLNTSGVNQIPAMTSNVQSGVTITSAGTQGAGFEEWRGADRVPSTFWYSGPQPATWYKVDFGAGNAKHIDTYSIQADPNALAATGWTLKGSNDDSYYFNIDTQSSQTWTAGQIRSYTPPSYP
jgi:hypothetical protein